MLKLDYVHGEHFIPRFGSKNERGTYACTQINIIVCVVLFVQWFYGVKPDGYIV